MFHVKRKTKFAGVFEEKASARPKIITGTNQHFLGDKQPVYRPGTRLLVGSRRQSVHQ